VCRRMPENGSIKKGTFPFSTLCTDLLRNCGILAPLRIN